MIMINFLVLLAFLGCVSARLDDISVMKDDCLDSDLLHSYDLEITDIVVDNGIQSTPVVWYHRKSGFNYHSFSEYENQKVQIIRIEGKTAAFEFGDGSWSTMAEIAAGGTNHILTEYPFPYVLHTLCPDVSNWQKENSRMIDGVIATRYSNQSSRWDYWINDEGKLVQADTIDPSPYENVHRELQVKFSGFGEPNVVVDPFPQVTPVYTSTPGPSPTPDPSATATPTSTPTSTPAPTATATPTPDGTLDLEGSLPRAAAVVLPTPTPRAVVTSTAYLMIARYSSPSTSPCSNYCAISRHLPNLTAPTSSNPQ